MSAAAAVTLTAVLATAPQAHAATLKDLATAKGLMMGFGIEGSRITGDAQYKAIVDAESSIVTPGNEMKWDSTEPSRGSFSFGNGDAIVSYAQSTGKKVYAHTLVWHSQYPSWVDAVPAAELRSAMLAHIAGVAGHYRGKVAYWDVVNEAFNEDGTRRASIFQTRIGPGYIAAAFRAARAADPTAKLCINDYNVEGAGPKSNGLYRTVKNLRAAGVPIDCVGFQAHLILGSAPKALRWNIARFAALGVEVRFTELDVRMTLPSTPEKLTTQAADYRRIFAACVAVKGCNGVTVWGVSDKDSWIPAFFPGQGAALLWDESYATKPAYRAVTRALGG